MDKSISDFPDPQRLTAGLTAALVSNGFAFRRLFVVARRPSALASTFPCEIVTCRTDKGTRLRLYCKYSTSYRHTCQDPRQGVAYEAKVYQHVLQPLRATTPRFYGAYRDPTTGESWLLLEYLEKSVHARYRNSAAFLSGAARWIGQFHAAHETKLRTHPLPFLVRFGAEYYLGCARGTSLYGRNRYRWLKTLCRRYEELVDLLVHPRTVVHGEYEESNILTRKELIYPVDWEAAAVGAGEIDLANLTWGWPAAIARKCEFEYQQARWPNGPPPEFERRLATARLHLYFRWLGVRREWTRDKRWSGWFEGLRSAGEHMGLI